LESTGVRFSGKYGCPAILEKRCNIQGHLPAAPLLARCILPFMKILVIDNDSERFSALKSLELNGHLVQAVEALSEVTEFLDRSFCQMLVLGPEQISGDPLKTFSEWRQSLAAETSPFVVVLGARQGMPAGIDHGFPIPFDKVDVIELSVLSGVPPEPEAIDYDMALEICDDDQDLLHEIVGIFLKDGPGRIEKLTRGMEAKDWKAVMESAHLMKGSALNLAAGSFRFANQNLERTADAGNASLIPLWFEQVVYEYRRLENHLKGVVGGSAELS
jgi:HPt (histidine-containing phosphotransfer) domain-containing protein